MNLGRDNAAHADCSCTGTPPPLASNKTDGRSRPGFAVSGSDVVFALLLALLSTSLSYRFGVGNQIEQIPIVLRQLDQSYLTNDFFVSTSIEFGPRFYFAKLLAWTCQLMPLPCAFYLFTLLANLTLIVVTQWAARTIVGADRLGAALAAVMAVGVSSFHLGDATQIRYEIFGPASLSIPGALWAVGLGLCGRPILAALVASISSLPHPLYGLEGGAIALGTAFFALLLPPDYCQDSASKIDGRRIPLAWRTALVKTAIGAAILGAAILIFWWWPYRGANTGVVLPTGEFFDILARFRAPHHYLPSQFRAQDYVTTGVFIVAIGLAFERWARFVTPRSAALLLLPILAVFAACVAGTLFTEFLPIRAVLTLQTFRLLSILKWLGYLLLGWLLGSYWQRPPNALARPLAAMSLLSGGASHALVTAAALLLIRLRDRLLLGASRNFWIGFMAVSAGILWIRLGALDEWIYLIAALGLAAAFSQVRRAAKIAATLLAAGFLLGLALNRGSEPFVNLPAMVPVFDFADHRGAQAEVARAAAKCTPPDALFVTPPSFGVLRIIGRRALVVDFKSLPFQDDKMREWRERMHVVYGDVEGGGFAALEALDKAYRATSDAHLRQIADRYGATHALLYSETATGLPELYVDGTYRIVELSPR